MHVLSLLDQTMEYSWVPLGMRAKLNEDGTVSLADIPKTEVSEHYLVSNVLLLL